MLCSGSQGNHATPPAFEISLVGGAKVRLAEVSHGLANSDRQAPDYDHNIHLVWWKLSRQLSLPRVLKSDCVYFNIDHVHVLQPRINFCRAGTIPTDGWSLMRNLLK